MPSVAAESAWRRWRADNPDVSGIKQAFIAGATLGNDPQEEMRLPYLAGRLVEQKADMIDQERKLVAVTAERDELLIRLENAASALRGGVPLPQTIDTDDPEA